MKPPLCQSCGFPLLEENKGANSDGTKNDDYCINCYQNGKFLDPSLTLLKMEVKLTEMAKIQNEISLEEAEQVIKNLPNLKRWQINSI